LIVGHFEGVPGKTTAQDAPGGEISPRPDTIYGRIFASKMGGIAKTPIKQHKIILKYTGKRLDLCRNTCYNGYTVEIESHPGGRGGKTKG
jgi:hypothetical protein